MNDTQAISQQFTPTLATWNGPTSNTNITMKHEAISKASCKTSINSLVLAASSSSKLPKALQLLLQSRQKLSCITIFTHRTERQHHCLNVKFARCWITQLAFLQVCSFVILCFDKKKRQNVTTATLH